MKHIAILVLSLFLISCATKDANREPAEFDQNLVDQIKDINIHESMYNKPHVVKY